MYKLITAKDRETVLPELHTRNKQLLAIMRTAEGEHGQKQQGAIPQESYVPESRKIGQLVECHVESRIGQGQSKADDLLHYAAHFCIMSTVNQSKTGISPR